jgi:hypothetical protein
MLFGCETFNDVGKVTAELAKDRRNGEISRLYESDFDKLRALETAVKNRSV